MKENLLKIIEHYSPTHQLKKLSEEVFELQEAIIKAENPFEPIQDIDHIVEEIADVMVLLNQFIHYYGIEEIDILKMMKCKVDRQIERIKNEDSK